MAKRETKKESPEKRLWRLLAGLAAILQSIAYLRSFHKIVGEDALEAAVWNAFMVTYSRPFKKNHDVQTLPLRHIHACNRELHHKILNFRDLYYGHIDPNAKMDSGEKLHRIQLRVTENGILPNPTFSRPTPDNLPIFLQHTLEVRESLDEAIQDLISSEDCLQLTELGDYVLDYLASNKIKRI